MEISMPVYIGLLMLLGIVAKNSILLVDFAIEEMDHGIAKVDALIDARRTRAQPIVITPVAIVAGMVPTALSVAGYRAWRARKRAREGTGVARRVVCGWGGELKQKTQN